MEGEFLQGLLGDTASLALCKSAEEKFMVCASFRKTGMSIVPNHRMPLAADGQEQMDLFFAQGPASIPPIQRLKSASTGKRQSGGNRNGHENGNEEEEEAETEEADEDQQTANYGKYAAKGFQIKPRTSVTNQSFEGSQLEDDGELENKTSENDVQSEAAPTPRPSKTSRTTSNANNSAAGADDDQEDMDEEMEGGGTQTMDLEGSEFLQLHFWPPTIQLTFFRLIL